jgi:predicted dehydrogenase
VDFIHLLVRPLEAPLIHASRILEGGESNSIDCRAAVILSFKDQGILTTLHCAIDSPSLNVWEVRCEKGSVSIPRFDPQGDHPAPLTIVNEDSISRVEEVPTQSAGLEQFRMEFQNFADCIQGTSSPFITPQESIRNAELIERIRKAFEGESGR